MFAPTITFRHKGTTFFAHTQMIVPKHQEKHTRPYVMAMGWVRLSTVYLPYIYRVCTVYPL